MVIGKTSKAAEPVYFLFYPFNPNRFKLLRLCRRFCGNVIADLLHQTLRHILLQLLCSSASALYSDLPPRRFTTNEPRQAGDSLSSTVRGMQSFPVSRILPLSVREYAPGTHLMMRFLLPRVVMSAFHSRSSRVGHNHRGDLVVNGITILSEPGELNASTLYCSRLARQAIS
ncbi:hypothetical protein K503DRAFT_238696 [Rhizopogon vinicolor AM-OR11-026]|uniref:Uncharacterized protein n=1 Tax=Rhizopogon vinicolor AM-OR11-026 TaxID=1314800 RepID=A0A1B7MXM1_9AGAM|nr:hypothetical protein K503DRAFT_238696 [Rhizopogon vinicolor AM-OR11-026]